MMRSFLTMAFVAAMMCSFTEHTCAELTSDQTDPFSEDAAFSIPYLLDAGGQPLDGSRRRYTLTFSGGKLPPARKWSLFMYELPQQTRVENSLHRFQIESAMLPNMQRNDDGGVTIYIEHAAPGDENGANWLPAPKGPFMMRLRLDGPEAMVLDADWVAPPVEPAELMRLPPK